MKKILFLCCLFPFLLQAQEWNIYESQVENVPEKGYYHIELTQQLIGVSRNNKLDDIRLYDSSGTEVPYFIRSEEAMQETQQLLYYELLENTGKDSINRIIMRNPNLELINRFLIISRPAEVSKAVQIRGSNDRSKWFIVKQSQEIAERYYTNQINEIIPVNFPMGNYQYYEITIRNSGAGPLDIEGVVKTKNQQVYNMLSPLPKIDFAQKDSSDHHTYIFFPDLPQNFRFDRIDFFITYPSDYYRQVIYAPNDQFSFQLSSNRNNSLYTETVPLTEKNYLRIDNQNSPPLTVDSIRFYGLNYYLCAYLRTGEKYKIVIDQQQGGYPQYDIIHFQSEIAADIPILKSNPPSVTHKQIEEDTRDILWIERPVVLWSIIIGAGVFLLLLCWRVMKEKK